MNITNRTYSGVQFTTFLISGMGANVGRHGALPRMRWFNEYGNGG